MKTNLTRAALCAALVAGALGAPPLAAYEREARCIDFDEASVKPIKDARFRIEFNATDRDAGVQLVVDSEPWKMLDVYDNRCSLIFRSTTRGRLGLQGGTELFLESAEPSLDEVPLEVFFKRFPAGNYTVVAHGLDGVKYAGKAKFTHNIPDGPALVAPGNMEVVDADNLVMRWNAVGAVNGSPIIGYQVIVVRSNTGLPALPKITLDVTMPPTATSMAVPPGFLQRDALYEWEVLAIESGGNQTLSSRFFRTAK